MKFLKQLIIPLLFLMALIPSTAFAAEGEGSGFSVSKVAPTSQQVKENSSFYDMLVSPGDSLAIQARLKNSSSEEMKIKVGAYTTFTNENGEINYTSAVSKKNQDKSLKIAFSDIATLGEDHSVTLAAGEEKVVSMDISVPADASDGVILGSWYFEKEGQDDTTQSSESDSNIQINNRFGYAMAVKLTVNQELSKPNLNLLKVKPGLNNYRKVINANVQNDQAAIVSKLNFAGEITRKGESDVLYSDVMEDVIMAPNSNFNVPYFLGNKLLKAGEYTLNLTATTNDAKWSEETWKWTMDFTITENQANKLNKAAVNDPVEEEEGPNYLLFILLGIIILLLLILLFILFRRKKKKDEETTSEK